MELCIAAVATCADSDSLPVGIVMSKTFGVAKGATAIALRACDLNYKGEGACAGQLINYGFNLH